MNKALDIVMKYRGKEEKLSIYTNKINISLIEMVNQSVLPSSSLPVKFYIGTEYIYKEEVDIYTETVIELRRLIREKVVVISNGNREVLELLDIGFNTAEQWFGN